MSSINYLKCKFLQFKIMHKILAYRSYSKEYPIDTKFDIYIYIYIKSIKNMQFNDQIFKILSNVYFIE